MAFSTGADLAHPEVQIYSGPLVDLDGLAGNNRAGNIIGSERLENYTMSYENPRIKLDDSTMMVLQKMAGGNPGAITVLVDILREGDRIDPQGIGGGFDAILSLDTADIYEERIWMLFKDVCGENLMRLFACLRANQLGFITRAQLNDAIDGKGGLDVDDMVRRVKERLDQFDVAPETASKDDGG